MLTSSQPEKNGQQTGVEALLLYSTRYSSQDLACGSGVCLCMTALCFTSVLLVKGREETVQI